MKVVPAGKGIIAFFGSAPSVDEPSSVENGLAKSATKYVPVPYTPMSSYVARSVFVVYFVSLLPLSPTRAAAVDLEVRTRGGETRRFQGVDARMPFSSFAGLAQAEGGSGAGSGGGGGVGWWTDFDVLDEDDDGGNKVRVCGLPTETSSVFFVFV